MNTEGGEKTEPYYEKNWLAEAIKEEASLWKRWRES